MVERRHQRSALATGGDIAAAKIGNDGNFAKFGQHGGSIDLYGVAGGRVMTNGLAMRAYGASLSGLNLFLAQQSMNGLRIEPGSGLARPYIGRASGRERVCTY